MSELPVDDAPSVRVQPGRSVRIRTGSRLHFGLLDTVEPFGGLGVMIDQPITEVFVCPHPRFSCDHEDQLRIQGIAERAAALAKLSDLPKCRVEIRSRSQAHCGLGSGTQLALAASEAICRYLSLPWDQESLACQIAMRAKRSAVGVHGYFQGGMILEGPATTDEVDDQSALNVVRTRIELPRDWRVALFQPTQHTESVSGQFEREKFASLSAAEPQVRASLNRIVGEVLVAAEQRDFLGFAAAVQRYNHQSGQLFANVQGGPYNGPAVTRLIDVLAECGAVGVGQSSWGPGVFAWFASHGDAEQVIEALRSDATLVAVAAPCNRPRIVEDVQELTSGQVSD